MLAKEWNAPVKTNKNGNAELKKILYFCVYHSPVQPELRSWVLLKGIFMKKKNMFSINVSDKMLNAVKTLTPTFSCTSGGALGDHIWNSGASI